MLRSNAFGCGPGHVVEYASTEKCHVFRALALPASSPNAHVREEL